MYAPISTPFKTTFRDLSHCSPPICFPDQVLPRSSTSTRILVQLPVCDIGHGTGYRPSRGCTHMAIRGIARSTDGSGSLKRSAPISAWVPRYPERNSPLNYYISIVIKTISHYLWFLQQLGKTPAARQTGSWTSRMLRIIYILEYV